jgi:hypothetical protein
MYIKLAADTDSEAVNEPMKRATVFGMKGRTNHGIINRRSLDMRICKTGLLCRNLAGMDTSYDNGNPGKREAL